MPDRDLAAMLRTYIEAVAEPVRAGDVMARRRRADTTVRTVLVAAVLAAAIVAVGLAVVMRSNGDESAPASTPSEEPTETSAASPSSSTTEESLAPTTAAVFPGAGLWPHVTATIDVGGDPQGIAFVDHTVWVAVSQPAGAGSVVAVDPVSLEVRTRYPTMSNPIDLAADSSALWVAGGGIERIDAASGSSTVIEPDRTFFGVVLAFGSVWAVSGGEVIRIDPDSNEVLARIAPVHGAFGIAAGAGSIWLADGTNVEPPVITRIDPTTDAVVAEIPMPARTRRLVATDAGVFATVFAESAGGHDGGVFGVDPATNQYSGQVPGGAWQGITLAGGHAWVVSHGGQVAVVTGEGAVEQVQMPPVGDVRSTGDAIAYGDGGLWAAAPASGRLVRIAPGRYG